MLILYLIGSHFEFNKRATWQERLSYSFLFTDSEAAQKIAEDTTSSLGSCYRVITAVLPWLIKNNVVSQSKAGTIFMYEPISELRGWVHIFLHVTQQLTKNGVYRRLLHFFFRTTVCPSCFQRLLPLFLWRVSFPLVASLTKNNGLPYEAAFKCTKAGWYADGDVLQEEGKFPTAAEILEAGCTYSRVSYILLH